MLSDKFKKKIKEVLKFDYGIECYRISFEDQLSYNPNYTNFKLTCLTQKKTINLYLTAFFDRSDMNESNVGTFNIFLPVHNLDDCSIVSHQVDSEKLYSALHEVTDLLTPFDSDFKCGLNHAKISIVNGHFNHEKGLFNIADINPFIETTSTVVYRPSNNNSFEANTVFCNFHILGSEITISSSKYYISNEYHYLNQNERVLLDIDGIKKFKAHIIKSFILYDKAKYQYSTDFKELDTLDILNASVEELEQILVLAHIQKI